MPPLDLDDTEKAALVELLRQIVDFDPYPLSPRVQTLKRILDKLDPPKPPPTPFPPVNPPGERSTVLGRKGRR